MAVQPLSSRVQLAVLTSEPGIADRVADRMTIRQRIEGERLVTVIGELGLTSAAVVRPRAASPDWSQVIRTAQSTHHPEWILAAGLVSPLHGLTNNIVPTPVGRAFNADGAAYQVAVLEDLPAISVNHPDAPPIAGDTTADAQAAWPGEVSAACCTLDTPLAMLALIDSPPTDDPEWQNLTQQQTAAGKLGAALGGLWRRPSFAKEAVSRIADRWKRFDDLVDRIERVAAAGPDGPSIGSPRRR